MNTGNVVSFPVGEDLSASAKSHISVKLTSAGLKAAGIRDLVVGTLLRGNVAPQTGQTIPTNFTPAADVLLTSGCLHFVKLGANSAAIAIGDELEQDASGAWLNKATTAAVTGAITSDSTTFTAATAHKLAAGDRLRIISLTGGSAFTAGDIVVVNLVGSTTTFTVSATKGGATLTHGSNVTAMVLQHVGDASGKIVIAAQGAPVTSTDGIIEALFL